MNETLEEQFAKWQQTNPGGSVEAFLAAQEKPKNLLQHVNDFLGAASRGLARLDIPRGLAMANPMTAGRAYEKAAVEEQTRAAAGQPEYGTPDYFFDKGAVTPGSGSLANAGRALGSFLDAPGETKFRDIGQATVEGGPRIAAMAAAGGAPLVADMVLQGYGGAKDAGLTSTQSAGAGLVGGAVGAAMPAFAGAGRSIAAQGMARIPGLPAVVERAGETVGSNLAMLIPQAAQAPATELATGQELTDPLSGDKMLEMGLSNLALAPLSVREVTQRPKVTAADGRMVEYPSATSLERVNLATERAQGRTDAMAKLYEQFMTVAPDEAVAPMEGMEGPPTPGVVAGRLTGKAYDLTKKLSNDELSALRPLEFLNPRFDNPVQQEAHEAFIKAAGLDVPQAKRADPSLTAYSGADYSDPKTLTPAGILDRVLAGEIVPTGIAGNEQNIQNVELLRRVFGPRAQVGENYVNMDRVTELAILADEVINRKRIPGVAEAPIPEKWSKLDNATQEAAVLAAKILRDPYTVLGKTATGGLDPMTWSTTEPNYLRSVHDMASTLYSRWDKPITTVEDAGALVRDVNLFRGHVDNLLNEMGLEENSDVPQRRELRQITKEHITAQYDKALSQYLENPTAEAAAQTLQWVKNQVLISVSEFKDYLARGVPAEEVSRIAQNRAQKDLQLDTEFSSMVKTAPKGLQGLLSSMYNAARSEKVDVKGETNWRLDDFRRSVTRSIERLTPEQRAVAETAADIITGLNPQWLSMYWAHDRAKIPEMLRKQATEAVQARADEGAEYNPAFVESEYKRLKESYDQTISEFEIRRETVKPILEKLPGVRVDVKAESGETPESVTEKKSNLYKVIFEPLTSRVMDARRGGKTVTSLDAMSRPQEDQTAIDPSVLTESDTGQREPRAKSAEDIAEPQAVEAQQNVLVEKYFQGTPRDPNEVINEIKPLQLEAALATIFGEKNWKNLTAKAGEALGITPNEARRGPAAEWIKDFLRADISEEGSALRKAWIAKHADAAKADSQGGWLKVRENMFGKDPAKALWLKARLMGLEMKPGVTADQLYQTSKATKATAGAPRAAKKQFEYDVLTAFNKHFLEQGYQPELAATLSTTLSRMVKNFSWLDNAKFAMLTDKNATAEQFFKDLRVLGVHIPTETMVAGKLVKNPIIALAMQDFVSNKEYAAFNGFLKLTTLAHEAFHAFEQNVVNNPQIHRMNEDTQAQVVAYRQMENLANRLSPEDRVRTTGALIDLMIPSKYVRGKDGRFTPEVQGIINGATRSPKEFMAFYYQIVAAGMASKLSGSSAKMTSEVRDAMQWLTKDEQSFLRGQFRNVGDMLEALQKTLDDPDYRRTQGYVTTERETRQVIPDPSFTEQSGAVRSYSQGQATEQLPPAAPTKKVTSEYTTPPTEGVGFAARSLAQAAETIARGSSGDPLGAGVSGEFGGPGSIQQKVNALRTRQAQLKGEVINAERAIGEELPLRDAFQVSRRREREYTEAIKNLAKVDSRVQAAESALKEFETFSEPYSVADRIARGEVLKVDLNEIGEGPKDFFISVFGKPPPPAGPNSKPLTTGGFFDDNNPQFTRSTVGKFLSKLQPQQFKTYDLYRRGLPLAEQIRQTLDRIQPEAHKVNHAIMAPITSRFGAFDSVRIDTTKDFFKFLSDDGKTSDPIARKALNDILRAQQSLKGLDVQDPQMQQVVTKALAQVPPAKRALVTTAVRTINEIYSNRATAQLSAAAESQMNAVAALMMRMAPGKFDSNTALSNAKETIRVSELGDIMEKQNYSAMMQQQGLTPGQADALLGVAATGHANVVEMQNRMSQLGNFASEQRVGDYILSYTNKAGERQFEGVKDQAEGRSRQLDLAKNGASNFHAIEKSQLAEQASVANSYEGMIALSEMINATHSKQVDMLRNVDPALADYWNKQFNPTAGMAEWKAVSSAQKNMLKRELKGGRESVDYVETMFDNVSRTSISLARRSAKERFELQNLEMEQMGNKEIANEFRTQLAEVMSPESPTLNKLKTTVTGWLVPTGANAMLELGQLLFSGNSVLWQEGLNSKQITSQWKDSIVSQTKWFKDGAKKQFNADANLGQQIETARYTGTPMLENKDATIAHFLRRMNDESRMGHEALMDLNGEDLLYTNLARASRTNDFNWKRPDQLAGNAMYWTGKNMLRVYSYLPRLNNWLASNTALRVGYDRGLRGPELYNHAVMLKDTMTIAGGRANKPSMFAVPGTGPAAQVGRSAVGMATMLSNYMLGATTILGGTLKDAVMGAKGLTPPQRAQSAKAAANAYAMQLSLAGALGLPFAGAMLWAWEQLTGTDTEKALRETARLGADDEMGELFSDVAMNGWMNRTTGADMASKAGVNSVFGINGYNGFDSASVVGPTGTFVKDLWTATGELKDGNPLQALAKFVPRGLRGLAETGASYAKYGDLRFTDNSNNLLHRADTSEALGYALGFQPAKVKEAKQKQRLVLNSERRFAEKDGRERDEIALELMKGNTQGIMSVISNRYGDPAFDAKEYIGNVIERAVDMQVEKDPTARGLKGNMKARGEIGALMPQEPTEQARVGLKQQYLMQLGNPFGLQTTQKDLLRAMVVDELRTQDRKMTRQEAMITADKLLGL